MMKAKTKRVNSFKPRKYQDLEIVDDAGRMIGTIRIKPSGILWAPADAKVWYGLPLAKFAAYVIDQGRTQKK